MRTLLAVTRDRTPLLLARTLSPLARTLLPLVRTRRLPRFHLRISQLALGRIHGLASAVVPTPQLRVSLAFAQWTSRRGRKQ